MNTINPNALPPGWTISPRLMAQWKFEDGSTIEVAAPNYRLALADGTTVEESADFFPGGTDGWMQTLEEFVFFLCNYFSCDHGDSCPFAPGWHEWCAAHEQELENLHADLTPPTDPDDGHAYIGDDDTACLTCNRPMSEHSNPDAVRVTLHTSAADRPPTPPSTQRVERLREFTRRDPTWKQHD
jgi:hypothetical protein